MKTLNGKRALVTGASSGIGRAIALELARHDAQLVISGRRTDALNKLADEIARLGKPRPTCLSADLSNPEDAARLAIESARALGGIDLLINNAGIGIAGTQVEVGDDAAARALFETNYWAPLRLLRALGPDMIARAEGTVVNVASIGAYVQLPRTGHYASSKAALAVATEMLHRELDGTGVHALLVLPGPIDTPMLDQGKQLSDTAKALRFSPQGTPEELARRVVKAILRQRKTLVYPSPLGLTRHLPTFANWVTRAVSGPAIRGQGLLVGESPSTAKTAID